MAILQDQYLLDVNQALTQLKRVDTEMIRITAARNINLNTTSITRALSQVATLRTQLNGLGGTNTRIISLRMNTGNLSAVPNQLLAVETGVRRLTAATSMNLGMTGRLAGVFGFIPGPLGLYAAAATTLTGALTGLTAAQKLNTIGAFALVGGLAALGVSTALLASQGVKQLGEFQAAVNTLNAQGPGLGDNLDAQIRSLQDAGGRVAKQFNRAELGTGVADLTKQGLDNAAALKVTATGYKLAAAEGQKLTDTNTLLLANLRQFGKDGPEAADAAAHFGDVLAKGSLLAASGARELQVGLSVVGPIADKANFSLEETVGILVALDNKGLKASTIGANAFRAVLLALASPTGVARKEIEQLGVATRNYDGSARNVRDILMDLRKAAQVSGQTYDAATKATLSQADSVEAASTIFRSRGVVGFLNMTDATDEYIKTLNGAESALDGYANALTEGPAKAQERLKKSVDDLALSFAQTFGPKLSEGLDKVAILFRDLDRLAQNKDTFKAYFEVLVVGFGAVTAAMILNSKAARLLLADSSFAGLMALYRGSLAAQLFTKVAAGLRAVALASAISFQTGGILGLLKFLALIPIGAAAALAGVALLAGGVAAYGLKVAADTRKIYDDIDRRGDDAQKALFARVAELRKQGPLGNLKAQQQLTISLRFNYENSPEQNALLDAKLLKLKQQIAAQQAADAKTLAAAKGKKDDVAATDEQSEAYAGLIQKLADLKTRFSETGTTTFQKNLQDARKSLEDFNAEVDKLLEKNEITPMQGDALKQQAKAVQPNLLKGIVDRQLKEDADSRLKHEREVQDAELALVKDGRQRRQLELERQVADTKKSYDEEVKIALQNAKSAPDSKSRSAFYAQAAALQRQQAEQLNALEAKGAEDLANIDEGRVEKVKASYRDLLDAQTKQSSAAVTLLTQQRDRELALAGSVPEARLAIEKQYGPLLARVQVAQQAAAGKAARAQLLASLAQQLKDAEDAGAQRGELEKNARATYLTNLRALELSEQAETGNRLLAQEERVQAQRLAIYKKSLDKRLGSLKDATGAEIAALERTLQAERAKAAASGDGGRVGAIDDALKQVGEVKAENLSAFREGLKEANREATDLQTQLREIAQTPLESARQSAGNPFTGIIKGAEKQLIDLRKSFGNVAVPTSDQTRNFQNEQNRLNSIITAATARRTQAQAAAEAAYYREREDKAQASHLSLSKRELELGRLTLDGYGRVLAADRVYWQIRAANAAAGSEGREQAELKLRENEDERLRLAAERRDLTRDSVAFSRTELQTAVELAQTDQARAVALARLNSSDQGRVTAIDAEIAALQKQGGHEREILTLRQEQAGLEKDLITRQRDQQNQARLLTDSTLARVEAENKLAQLLARTDGDSLRAQQDLLDLYQRQLVALDDKIAAATSKTEENGYLTERLNLLGQIEETQQGINGLPLAIEERRLGLYKAQAQTQLVQAGLDDDAVATALLAQDLAERDVELAREKLALTIQEGTQAEQDAARTALAQADGAAALARRQVALAPLDAQERSLALLKASVAQQLELNGLADDGVAIAAAAVREAEEGLRLADERVRLAQTPASRSDALLEQIGAVTALNKSRRDLAGAQLASEDRQLATLRAQAQAQAQISGLSNDTVASKQLDLAFTERELQATRQRLADAGRLQLTEQQVQDLRTKSLELLGQEAQQHRDLARAQVDQQRSALDLSDVQRRAQTQLRGLADDAVTSAQDDLDITRQRQALNAQQLADQGKLGLSQQEINGLLVDQANLTAQASQNERKLLDAQRARRDLLDGLAQAQTNLMREALGGSAETRTARAALEGVADARTKLTQAERQYAEAQADVERAQSSGNLEKFRTATDNLTSAIAGQRGAVRNLATSYTDLLGQMKGIQDAAAELRRAAFGEGKDGQSGQAFDFNQERARLLAIEARRDAAQKELAAALKSGDKARIQAATQDLATQQDRYNKQYDFFAKNGGQIAKTGQKETERLSKEVDRLGIQYDRDAVALQKRAELVQRESEITLDFAQQLVDFGADQQVNLVARVDLAAQERETVNLFRQAVTALGAVASAFTVPALSPSPAPQLEGSALPNAAMWAAQLELGGARAGAAFAQQIQDVLNQPLNINVNARLQSIPAAPNSLGASNVTYHNNFYVNDQQRPNYDLDDLVNETAEKVIDRLGNNARRAGSAPCPPRRR